MDHKYLRQWRLLLVYKCLPEILFYSTLQVMKSCKHFYISSFKLFKGIVKTEDLNSKTLTYVIWWIWAWNQLSTWTFYNVLSLSIIFFCRFVVLKARLYICFIVAKYACFSQLSKKKDKNHNVDTCTRVSQANIHWSDDHNGKITGLATAIPNFIGEDVLANVVVHFVLS